MFTVIVSLMSIRGWYDLKSISAHDDAGGLYELQDSSFTNSVSSGITCVLFHNEESDLCRKMESNLGRVHNETNSDIRFYKLNYEKYPGKYGKYEISGVPSVLIYKDGQEIERITGIVSVSNLKMILKRAGKLRTN